MPNPFNRLRRQRLKPQPVSAPEAPKPPESPISPPISLPEPEPTPIVEVVKPARKPKIALR